MEETVPAAASKPAAAPAAAVNPANLLYRPPSSIVPSSGPGLRFSWIVYRGKAAAVTFTPDQMKTWTDTRVVRELAVVAAVRHSRAAAGRQVGGAGDVQRAGHLRAARGRERRLAVHVRERDRHRHPIAAHGHHEGHEEHEATRRRLAFSLKYPMALYRSPIGRTLLVPFFFVAFVSFVIFVASAVACREGPLTRIAREGGVRRQRRMPHVSLGRWARAESRRAI